MRESVVCVEMVKLSSEKIVKIVQKMWKNVVQYVGMGKFSWLKIAKIVQKM
jgi:hypothetical protein